MEAPKKPWRKNLYENEEYEDNYTGPSFLEDMKTNINVQEFTFIEAFYGASRLSQEFSCVTCFLIVFYYLYNDLVSPEEIMYKTGTVTTLGYLYYIKDNLKMKIIVEDFKTVLTVLVFGYIFSPILYTLTDSISTDTIFTATFFVMFLHLCFFYYGMQAFMVSPSISLNAAIFGSICLASRLSSSFHAFVLMVVAAVFFALIPMLVNKIRCLPLLCVSIGICSSFLLEISLTTFFMYALMLLFVNLVCPYAFVKNQKYKNNIHGPWDEAILFETEETANENENKI